MNKLDSKKIMNGLLLLTLLPLLFIDINAFHNWGDDFAQYLWQAADLVHAKNLNEQPMFDLQNIAPLNRGSGFSLMLSALYALFGLNMQAFLILISCTLVALALVLYRFYCRQLPFKSAHYLALILVLMIVYNRHVLFLKTEVLPVFPMMALLYLCLTIYHGQQSKRIWLLAICSGVLLSMANVAWVFYLSVFLMQVILFKNKPSKSLMLETLILLLVPLFVYTAIKSIVFKTLHTDDISWYQGVFSIQSFGTVLKGNLIYYKDVFFLSFDQDIWFVFNKGIKLLMLVLVSSGFYYKVKSKFRVEDLFFILYLMLLLVYPDNGSGIRFLMPLIPLILLYSAFGCRFILDRFTIQKHQWVLLLYACVLLSYSQNIKQNIHAYAQLSEGPYEKEAVASFNFIRDSTDQKSAVAFFKPWTIQLYADRAAMPISSKQTFEEIKTKMLLYGVNYILFSVKNSPPEIFNATAMQQTENDKSFRCVYQNQHFKLFCFKPAL